jgi:hypothetical protein
VLSAICAHTGWHALDVHNSGGGQSLVYFDFGADAQQSWANWQQFRNDHFESSLRRAEKRGKKMIFTTLTEIRSGKPVAEFEDIRSLHLGEQRKP